MRVFLGLSVLFIGLVAQAEQKCSKSSLAAKDCHLRIDKLKLQFRSEKIHIHDGYWPGLAAMPIHGENVTWQLIKLRKIGDRYFAEQLLWNKPKGEGQVQSLHWYVMEFVKDKGYLLLDKVLGKKQIVDKKSGSPMLADPPLPYALWQNTSGKMRWKAGAEEGPLKNPPR